MKTIFKSFLLIPLAALLISCSRDITSDGLTYADFERNLKSSMSYEEIVHLFGQPSKDIGSGIHIYVYELTDQTEMWIGYTNSILYARQMDSNRQLIRSLI